MASKSMRRLGLAAGVIVIVDAGAAGAVRYVRSHDPLSTGRALQAKGDFRGASLELRNAVRAHPENAEAHWRLGTTLLTLGDPVAAEKELEAARDRGFDARAVFLPLAQSYLDQQRFADLLRDFPTDHATPEQLPVLLTARASAQLGLRDAAGAQASIDAAERAAPKSPEVAFAAARVAAARGDYPAASREVDRSLSLSPHNGPAQFMRAELLNLKGDGPGAIAALDLAITEQPRMQQARLARANLLMAAGQDARAKADVDAVLAEAPKDPIATYMQGVLLVRVRDYAGADQAFQKIATVISRIPRGAYFEALTKASLGQSEQAFDGATRYVARNPTDLAGIKLLTRIDMAAQRPDRAIEVLNRAAAAGASDVETLDLLGRAYALVGRQDQAVVSFEHAASLAPKDSEILTRLASARLGSGDASGAATDYAHSLDLAPNQADIGERAVTSALAAGDISRAQAALARLRESHANPALVGMLDGTIKTATLDYAGAREAFAAVLHDDAKSVPARLGLAAVSQLEGKLDETERLLREAVGLQPTNETALSRLLGVLLGTNRPKDALAVAETALKSEPGNVTLVTLLSDMTIRTGDPKRGLAVLDALPKDRAAQPTVLAARARLQVALGNPDDAKKIYRQILAATPGDLAIRIALLTLLTSTGDMAGAQDAVHDGLLVAPGNPVLLNSDVMLVSKAGGVDAALREADVLARDSANAPAAYELRGNVLRANNRLDEAAVAYAAALKAAPSTTLAVDLASALSAAGKTEPAIRAMRDWVATNQEDMVAVTMLAGLEIAAKRYDDAVPHLQAVLARRPNDGATLNNLAWIYQQKGDARALPLSQKAYLLNASPQAADTLGWILTTQGKADEAMPLLRQALAGLQTDPEVAYHYAVALKDTGQKEAATKMLKLLTTTPGPFEDKDAARKLLDEMGSGK